MSAEMSWAMGLNDDLKFFRRAMGLSRGKAAELIGVAPNTLKRYESGEQNLDDIAVGTYQRLTQILDEWQRTVEARAKRRKNN